MKLTNQHLLRLRIPLVLCLLIWIDDPQCLRSFSEAIPLASASAEASEKGFSYAGYSRVLSEHVDDQGLVSYARLRANPQSLNVFLSELETLETDIYDSWNEKEKVAFWINAYNVLTLQAVIRHYPIQSSFLSSLRFPKNSIRQIPGVWDKLKFKVMGRGLTLDGIEHEILRKQFDEPRIHMALVCAAMSCPPLRAEPFFGDKLDLQLDDQTLRFLNHPRKLRLAASERRIYLSPIFKWFGKDFLNRYRTKERFAGHTTAERAVLNFLYAFVDSDARTYLDTSDYRIEYLDYDWSLNEQPDP